MDKPKTNLEYVEDFCRHFCIVCREKIIVVCGTPVIHIGGCCNAIEDDKEKVIYVRNLKSHFHCYIEAKSTQKKLKNKEVKTRWKIEEVKKAVDDYYKMRDKRKKNVKK